jgi:hypothetical protein
MKKIFISFAAIIFLFSCKKDELQPGQVFDTPNDEDLTINSGRLKIGDRHADGIIFYFSDDTHKHGRVCALQY